MSNKIIKYLKNFGNIYTEKRHYEIPNTWCADPMMREIIIKDEAYVGVPYKNKYLYMFEFWTIIIITTSPVWLIILYFKQIEPYVQCAMKKGMCFILNIFFK